MPSVAVLWQSTFLSWKVVQNTQRPCLATLEMQRVLRYTACFWLLCCCSSYCVRITSKETQALIPTWKCFCKDFSHSRRWSFKLCLVSNSKWDFSHWKTNSVQKWTVHLVLLRTKCEFSRSDQNNKTRRKLIQHVSGGSDNKLGYYDSWRNTFTILEEKIDKLEGFSRHDNLKDLNSQLMKTMKRVSWKL